MDARDKAANAVSEPGSEDDGGDTDGTNALKV